MNRAAFTRTLLAASALGSRAEARAPGDLIPPWALQHDLDQLWNTMLAVGVYPFASSDRASVTQRYRDVRADLARPLDARAFALAVSPVFGAVNDGHVGVRPNAAFMNSLAVPVCLAAAGSDTIVLSSYANAVQPGSTLLSLGGVEADRIHDATLAGWGGQTDRLRVERFPFASRIVATILANDPASYGVRWRTPDGLERRATLPRAIVAPPWGAVAAPYTFSTVGGGSIGVIDYRQCVGPSRFKTFLERTFAFVRSNRVRAMIVDIRYNSGGDSDLNNELWSYLTAKTFTQFGPIVMRSSNVLKALYGKARYVDTYGIETWDAPNGSIVTYSEEKIGFITPERNPLRFNGPVVLLIGPRTFSSALDCAVAAKDFNLATLIGEETSEPVNTTGELFETSTRYAGITGSFTTKYFTPPKPAPKGRGVMPDIEVLTTVDDIVAHHDPVLARAIAHLR